MKFRSTLLLSGLALSATCYSFFAQVPNPGSEGKLQLQWAKDYPEALKKAEAEKKPLLIDITTDWCGWSKKMDRESFSDLAVQKELRSFVLIRLNPEASEANQKTADSYGGDGFPTLVVANSRGEQIAQQSGYANAKELLEFLRRSLPVFKGNPLGYKTVQLPASDPLLKAIQRIPPPESRPTSVGSFVVLDQTAIQLRANGTASFTTRTATFIADPEKGDLPEATGHYSSSRQKLKFKSVRILNTLGTGREVDVKLARDEHAYSSQNVYWDVRTVSLNLPHLKEGQILDVIEEREIQPIMPLQFFFRWNTGTKILLSSDLAITFPSSLKLQKRAVRCPGKIEETKNPDGTITWQLRTSNPKPYEPEMFSPPLNEIWEGYEFYTACSKDQLASWFSGLCQGRDTLPTSARQKIAELKKASHSQAELLQAIMDWVTKDVRYVSVAFGASSHQPHPVSETLTNLYGDCKDQSLLVQALCREAGIPASLVLLDVFGEDFNETCPAADRFNHCIVQATADGGAYYVDTSAGRSKIDHVSKAYAGIRALKIDGPAGSTVTLPPYRPLMDEASSETTIKLNPNGSATITEITHLAGGAAAQMKERMKNTTAEKMRTYLEDTYKKTGRKLLDFSVTGINPLSDKYETRISFTVPRFGTMTAGGLAFKLGQESQRADWIEALNLPRTQPLRFPPTDPSKVTFTVEFPAGAVLKGEPEDIEIDTPFMKATRKLLLRNKKLSVTESFRFLDCRLDPTQSGKVYTALRKLHDHREYAFILEMPSTSAASGQ